MRLLANFAPGFAIVFAVTTLGLAGSTVAAVVQLASETVSSTQLPWAFVSLTLNLAATVLAAAITRRLGLEVPRTVRGWQIALAERARALQRR